MAISRNCLIRPGCDGDIRKDFTLSQRGFDAAAGDMIGARRRTRGVLPDNGMRGGQKIVDVDAPLWHICS